MAILERQTTKGGRTCTQRFYGTGFFTTYNLTGGCWQCLALCKKLEQRDFLSSVRLKGLKIREEVMDDINRERPASLYKEHLLTYLPSQGDLHNFAGQRDSKVHHVHGLLLPYDRVSKEDVGLRFADWPQAYRKGFEYFDRNVVDWVANEKASPSDLWSIT